MFDTVFDVLKIACCGAYRFPVRVRVALIDFFE